MEQEIKLLQTIMALQLLFTIAIQVEVSMLIGKRIREKHTKPGPQPTPENGQELPWSRFPDVDRSDLKMTEETFDYFRGRLNSPHSKLRRSSMDRVIRETTQPEWKSIESFKVPTQVPVDVKTGKGTIYTRCYLNSTQPEEWDPEFIKYKGIKYWRYSS